MSCRHKASTAANLENVFQSNNSPIWGIVAVKFDKRFLKINIVSQLCYFKLGKCAYFIFN